MIDFTELLSDPDYGEDFLENIEGILTALDGFYEYAGAHKVYFTWQSVMDVMLDFINYANFSGETYCSSTYLSMLNGLGEFSAGSNSGWMYMDGEYEEDCSVPMVGAADYLLGDAPLFTWFFTTDYPSHF